MQTRSFPKSLLTAFALTGGLALGCVIGGGGVDDDGGSNECPSGSNNHELLDTCYCDAGYQWEDPNDPNNYNCVDDTPKPTDECTQPNNIEIGGQCYCNDGYEWCSDDPSDYSCCMQAGHEGDTGADDNDTGADDVADTGDTGDTGVDTGADTGNDGGVEPDPASCTADTEGFGFCSNTEAQGPADSRYWVCTSGEWVENTTAANESCMFDGFDFAYGCVALADSVEFVCGDGPGTACEGDSASCVDMDVINYCLYGKLTEDSCMRICSEEGDDMGVTYDYGECAADTMECFCCDAGTEGCPAE